MSDFNGTPFAAPDAAQICWNWVLYPTDLADWTANYASYLTPPGVTLYAKGKAPASASNLTTSPFGGPGLALGDGTGGTADNCKVWVDWSQFKSLKPATLTGPASPPAGFTAGHWEAGWVEIAVAFDNGSGLECSGWFMTVLGTAPYKKA